MRRASQTQALTLAQTAVGGSGVGGVANGSSSISNIVDNKGVATGLPPLKLVSSSSSCGQQGKEEKESEEEDEWEDLDMNDEDKEEKEWIEKEEKVRVLTSDLLVWFGLLVNERSSSVFSVAFFVV